MFPNVSHVLSSQEPREVRARPPLWVRALQHDEVKLHAQGHESRKWQNQIALNRSLLHGGKDVEGRCLEGRFQRCGR